MAISLDQHLSSATRMTTTLFSNFTDDSICTVAVAEWLLDDPNLSHAVLEQKLVEFANEFPCPMGGYGGGFRTWLFYPEQLKDYRGFYTGGERVPYNSWGNGSAMRVSAVGWMFDTLWQTENAAEISASITHNHPEGIKGAQATAAAIFMARTGSTKEEIRKYIEDPKPSSPSSIVETTRMLFDWLSLWVATATPLPALRAA